jgi:hypothetical protein
MTVFHKDPHLLDGRDLANPVDVRRVRVGNALVVQDLSVGEDTAWCGCLSLLNLASGSQSRTGGGTDEKPQKRHYEHA